MAHWFRDGVTEALTAYLPGLDEDDEYVVEQMLAAKPFPISLHVWHKVLKAERPVCVNFLMTRRAAEDRFLSTTANALGVSFLSILGMT